MSSYVNLIASPHNSWMYRWIVPLIHLHCLILTQFIGVCVVAGCKLATRCSFLFPSLRSNLAQIWYDTSFSLPTSPHNSCSNRCLRTCVVCSFDASWSWWRGILNILERKNNQTIQSLSIFFVFDLYIKTEFNKRKFSSCL